MEIKVKYSEIPVVVYQLAGVKILEPPKAEEEEVFGLLNEVITIGMRGRIQSILEALEVKHREFNRLLDELLTKHGAITREDGRLWLEHPSEEYNTEFKAFVNQEHTLYLDPINLAEVEAIKTDRKYNVLAFKKFCA